MRLLFVGLLLLGYTCRHYENSVSKNEAPSDKINGAERTSHTSLIEFRKDVQPILEARCMPCHFPGGKMYGKMPFDTALTLVGHSEGILRRIKDPVEKEKIESFLRQLASR